MPGIVFERDDGKNGKCGLEEGNSMNSNYEASGCRNVDTKGIRLRALWVKKQKATAYDTGY